MLHDFMQAIRAGLREYRRLRWVKQHVRQVRLPF